MKKQNKLIGYLFLCIILILSLNKLSLAQVKTDSVRLSIWNQFKKTSNWKLSWGKFGTPRHIYGGTWKAGEFRNLNYIEKANTFMDQYKDFLKINKLNDLEMKFQKHWNEKK